MQRCVEVYARSMSRLDSLCSMRNGARCATGRCGRQLTFMPLGSRWELSGLCYNLHCEQAAGCRPQTQTEPVRLKLT